MVSIDKNPKRSKAKHIPESLIYEIIDGKPFYYKGYKDVLSNKKTAEEIIGSSGIQSFIIQYLFDVLYLQIGRKKYHFLTNEIGTHIDNKNNLSGDIYVYEKAHLPPEKSTYIM